MLADGIMATVGIVIFAAWLTCSTLGRLFYKVGHEQIWPKLPPVKRRAETQYDAARLEEERRRIRSGRYSYRTIRSLIFADGGIPPGAPKCSTLRKLRERHPDLADEDDHADDSCGYDRGERKVCDPAIFSTEEFARRVERASVGTCGIPDNRYKRFLEWRES